MAWKFDRLIFSDQNFNPDQSAKSEKQPGNASNAAIIVRLPVVFQLTKTNLFLFVYPFQVNFTEEKIVMAIVTKGRGNYGGYYVTSYKVYYFNEISNGMEYLVSIDT